MNKSTFAGRAVLAGLLAGIAAVTPAKAQSLPNGTLRIWFVPAGTATATLPQTTPDVAWVDAGQPYTGNTMIRLVGGSCNNVFRFAFGCTTALPSGKLVYSHNPNAALGGGAANADTRIYTDQHDTIIAYNGSISSYVTPNGFTVMNAFNSAIKFSGSPPVLVRGYGGLGSSNFVPGPPNPDFVLVSAISTANVVDSGFVGMVGLTSVEVPPP